MDTRPGICAALSLVAVLAGNTAMTQGKARFDPGFGDGGLVETKAAPGHDLGGAVSVAEAPGGSLIVLGNDLRYGFGYKGRAVIGRYLENGRLDRGFGRKGFFYSRTLPPLETQPDGNRWGEGRDLAIDGQGRILTAGWHEGGTRCRRQIFLLRVSPDARADTGFGVQGASYGCLIKPAGWPYVGVYSVREMEANAVDVAADGRILVAGKTIHGRSRSGAFVARFRDGGELDRSFHGGQKTVKRSRGIVEIQPRRSPRLRGFTGTFTDVIALRHHKVLAAGMLNDALAIVRLDASGRLDRSFGKGGKVRLDFGRNPDQAGSFAGGAAIDSRGRIVVAGQLRTYGRRPGFGLVIRLKRDGHRDRSFGHRGIVRFRTARPMYATRVAIQKDGRIVVGGEHNGRLGLIRLNPGGGLDRTFSDGGILNTGGSGGLRVDVAKDVMIDHRGRIVVIGGRSWESYEGFWIARILP